VKRPVDSITTSTPRSFQGSFAGSRSAVARDADVAREGAVVRIVFKEVRALGGAGEVVDRDDLDARMALERGFEKITTDAAKTVDTDAHGDTPLEKNLRRLVAAAHFVTRPSACSPFFS
jgi:hypothetical protein